VKKEEKGALPICAVSAWCLEPNVQVGIYMSHQVRSWIEAKGSI